MAAPFARRFSCLIGLSVPCHTAKERPPCGVPVGTLHKDFVEHSDSTYLANAWEYNGNYAATGNTLYDIAAFLAQFKGKSADTAIAKYVLTSQDAEGGVPVEGGIDMTVTGATRTPNAVIAAVNAAIEQFKADVPKA